MSVCLLLHSLRRTGSFLSVGHCDDFLDIYTRRVKIETMVKVCRYLVPTWKAETVPFKNLNRYALN